MARKGVVALFVTAAGAALFFAIQAALTPSAPDEIPTIRADSTPVKRRPVNPGGLVVPNQETSILNHGADTAAPKVSVLPSPEVPLPRPAEPIGPARAPAAPVESLLPHPEAQTPATVATEAAAPPAAGESDQPPAMQDVPEAAPAADDGPAVRLQLASVGSEAEAGAEIARLQRRYPDLLGALPMNAVRADLGARGVVYRLQAGPLSQAQAAAICAQLKAIKAGCLLVR